MKKIISILLLGAVLTSCGAPAASVTEPAKIPFAIKVKTYGDFPTEYTVQKTGRLVGSSSISMAAQGVGRVDAVLVKEGMEVKKGQILVRLRDTTANYDLRLSQASNGLSNTKNSAESTRISLDKAVQDAKLAVERAQIDYDTAVDNAKNNLDKATRDADKSNLGQSASDANITLSQLQASLEKAKLDYQNLIVANKQTLLNYNTSFQNSLSDIRKFYTKVLFEGDRLYGITPKFQFENNDIRPFLGGGRTNQFSTLEFAYFDLQKAGTQLEARPDTPVDEANLILQLDEIAQNYKTAKAYLDAAGKYLENSVVSTVFPQSKLDALIATNNGYKSEIAGIESSWVAFRNGASTFLANYKNNESSAASGLIVQEKNIEVQKRQLATSQFDSSLNLEKTKTANNQSIANANLALETAKNNLENATKNRTLTLEKLKISETDASLNVSQAQREYEKLIIRAPIDGSITRVPASVGADVNPGTPMVELANRNPEIIFDVEANIAKLLEVGASQKVSYQGKEYEGIVVGVSAVATDTLLYSARIKVQEPISQLGQVATISLQIPSDHRVLPTDLIKILSERRGEIQTIKDGQLSHVEVDLGNIVGSSVEILTDVPKDTTVILNNVSNFDSKKSELKIEN